MGPPRPLWLHNVLPGLISCRLLGQRYTGALCGLAQALIILNKENYTGRVLDNYQAVDQRILTLRVWVPPHYCIQALVCR